MGFLDTVGKAGKMISKGIISYGDQCKDAREKMAQKTEDQLLRVVKNGAGMDKTSAYAELKKRGFSPEDIKARIS